MKTFRTAALCALLAASAFGQPTPPTHTIGYLIPWSGERVDIAVDTFHTPMFSYEPFNLVSAPFPIQLVLVRNTDPVAIFMLKPNTGSSLQFLMPGANDRSVVFPDVMKNMGMTPAPGDRVGIIHEPRLHLICEQDNATRTSGYRCTSPTINGQRPIVSFLARRIQ